MRTDPLQHSGKLLRREVWYDGGMSQAEYERWKSLVYLSKRLSDDWMNRHALRARRGAKVQAEVGFDLSMLGAPVNGKIATQHSPLDEANPFLRALAVDEALSTEYSIMDFDQAPASLQPGDLVRVSILFQFAELRLWGGHSLSNPQDGDYHFLAYAGIDTVRDIGRVFVGLTGSAHNEIRSGYERKPSWRTASDARGLYEMIRYTAEPNEAARIEPDALESEWQEFRQSTAAERIKLIADGFRGYGIKSVAQPFEVLMEVHHVATQVDLQLRDHGFAAHDVADLAICGAPIYIRTVDDDSWLGLDALIAGGTVSRGLRDQLNAELYDCRPHRLFLDPRPAAWAAESEEMWAEFCQWAFIWCRRIAPTPAGLWWWRPRRSLFGFRFGDQEIPGVVTDIAGWPIGERYFLSTSGHVYETYNADDRAQWTDRTAPIPLKFGEEDAQEAIAQTFEILASWLRPFA